MTLGATFKSFTQKQIESEKQLNATIQKNTDGVSELNKSVAVIQDNVKKLDENVTKIDEDVQVINESIIQIPGQYIKTEDFENYKKEVNQKLGSVYTIKGSIENYTSLIALESKNIGDVYNLLDSGANYVYTDSGWDKLSETIDLSAYLKTEDAKLIFVSLEAFQNLVTRVEAIENKNNEEEGGII